jgi:hypothetical protein
MTDLEKSLDKELGEPLFVSFNDETNKARRNLVALSFVGIAYKISGAQITAFSPLGLTIGDFRANFIDQAFFVFIIYSFIHFFWLSLDAFHEWRVRITGTRLAYVTTAIFAHEHADYPNDPRQSSLMTWWLHEAKQIKSFRGLAISLEQRADLVAKISREDPFTSLNFNNLSQAMTALKADIQTLNQTLERVDTTLASPRIPASLARFEAWYRMFSVSQLARWLILEWGLPLVLATIALFWLFPWWAIIVNWVTGLARML